MSPIFVALVLTFAFVVTARYLYIRRTRTKFEKLHLEALEEQKAFLKSFSGSTFDYFSAFDFEVGMFSHVSPFPRRVSDQWRYRISLEGSEAEDVVTITHEISECTIGRLIEKLSNIEKPLYLYRKENDRFWVHGTKQKYLVEHVLATLGEVDDLTLEKLNERLNKEDAKAWLNLQAQKIV